MSVLNAIKLGGQCVASLEARGLTVSEALNDQEAAQRIEAIRDYPVSLPLSPRQHDFTDVDSFWLFFQYEGFDVGSVCARCFDLGRADVADYWSHMFNRLFFPAGDGKVDIADMSRILPLRGKLIYLGDLFMDEALRGSRDQLLDIMHLLFATAYCKWSDFDWMYSFLRNKDQGKAQFYGFTDILPTPLSWSRSSDGRSNDEHIAALPAERLIYSIPDWIRQRAINQAT